MTIHKSMSPKLGLNLRGNCSHCTLCGSPAQLEDSANLDPGAPLRAQPRNCASIHTNTRPAQYYAFGLRIPQCSLDPLADQIALELCHRRHNGEQGLPEWRSGVDVFLIADELNPECSELFQGEQEMLGGAGEAVKAPHQHAIEPALAGVVHQPVQRAHRSLRLTRVDSGSHLTQRATVVKTTGVAHPASLSSSIARSLAARVPRPVPDPSSSRRDRCGRFQCSPPKASRLILCAASDTTASLRSAFSDNSDARSSR